MARRFFRRRGFRRRARPKTYWLTGRTFGFATGFDLQEVASTGIPLCHSAEISLINAGDFLTAGGEGFILHRIVGQIRHFVGGTTEDGQVQILPDEGADIRRSFQKRRIFGSTDVSVIGGSQQHSHLYSQVELGDEDILHTAAFTQPSTRSELNLRIPALIQDFMPRVIIENNVVPGDDEFTHDTFANVWADQLGPTVRDIDISCRRKVMEDDLPFLYYDVCSADGVTPLSVSNPTLFLKGYLRFLVTKSR